MNVEFLVEEPSAEAALNELVPRILGEKIPFRIHVHQGKRDLLKSLPARLRGYSKWLPADWYVVVLVDLDSGKCAALKNELEQAARGAGLVTRTAAGEGCRFQVLNRIAIEELEAWFFGDVQALCRAYPGVPRTLAAKRNYRDPDCIRGGTWEQMERVLKTAGYHRGGLAKIAAAREIARHMDPDRNQSHSFAVFRDGLRAMVKQGP